MGKLKSFLVKWKNQLFTLSSGKRVGKFAIVMILALDIQILYLVLDGTSKTSRSLTYPINPVSRTCESFYKEFSKASTFEKTNFISSISESSGGANKFIYDYDSSLTIEEEALVAPACRQARTEVSGLRENATVQNLLRDNVNHSNKIDRLYGQIHELKASYDSALLEKIAGQEQKDSILPAPAREIRKKIEQNQTVIKVFETEILKNRDTLVALPEIVKIIEFASKANVEKEISTYQDNYRWQLRLMPVKSLAMGLLFLTPLLVFALLWHRSARKKESALQIMASSHMVLIALLPMLFKFAFFIYSLLPHTFLSRLYEFLLSLNISFIWNYLVILVTIAGFGLVIWASQKFLFNPERRRRNRIKHHECVACEERLESLSVPFCYYCGAEQLKACGNCHKMLNKNFLHCQHCGVTAGA